MQTTVEKLFVEILDIKPPYTIGDKSSFAEILPCFFLKFLKLFGDETTLQSIQSSTFNKSVIFRLDPQKTNGIDGWFTVETLSNKIWFCIKFFPYSNYPKNTDTALPFLVLQAGYWKKNAEGMSALTEENLLSSAIPNIKYSVRDSLGMITNETPAFIDIKLFLLEKIIKMEVLPYSSWIKEKQQLFAMNSSVPV